MCGRIKRNQFNRPAWCILTIVTLLMHVLVFPAIGAERIGWEGNKIGVDATTTINIDAPEMLQAKRSNPIRAISPIRVIWHAEGTTMVVQVYRKGKLIYPAEDEHKEHGSGVTITLSPGKHEIKVWTPGTGEFKSIWVIITE